MKTYINALGETTEGKEVMLMGWVHSRRNMGKLIFFDLRDSTGLLQVVCVPSEMPGDSFKAAADMRPEFVVTVKGIVQKRSAKQVNKEQAQGSIELLAKELTIVSVAKTPPFEIVNEDRQANEELRLKYRYLDLRHERMQKNILKRHGVIKFYRDYLTREGFVEIETPLLTKSTPEGARDYIVPSRINKGKFYALPQSPQQYKQLLMVAGFERYFQIARALRDEDTRGDRQPEHTQLDIEMSFVTPEDVMSLLENMTISMMKVLYPKKKMKVPWPRITYQEAMKKYGSDKPDMRENKNDPDEISFAWVVDFPQFEKDKETGQIQPVHHMFVQPQKESLALIDSEPLKMISTQYDWVCNGYELASGSIRITDPGLQMKVFKLLGMNEKKACEDFGHLLEAFTYGVPPHGGIAPGIDRLLMILQNEPNIREVIAFPKTSDGRDPMMDSPSEVDKEQLDELGLTLNV